MSARYDRKPVAPPQFRPAPSAVRKPATRVEAERAAAAAELEPADHRAAWEALDRGEDPTG